MQKSHSLAWRALALGLVFLGGTPAFAGKPLVYTNQGYVEDAQNVSDIDIKDMKAVLELVLGSLPATVKVYPTENYFYFSFYHQGIKYAGNLRFDATERDKGSVHFNYFKDFTNWQRDESGFSAIFGAKDGVILKPAGKLTYDLEFKGKRVQFVLNDLSGVKPPVEAVAKGESYLGPVFDESGIRFFLLFNPEEKIFLYVLDETVPVAEQFNVAASADRISVGIRTGFAFYADRFAKRKILVGVNQANTSINNYLDGPFDQLPDNFMEGDTLRKAILTVSPEMEGKIDRFGNSPDGETRYLIAPYLQYEDEKELGSISACAASAAPPAYYHCFSYIGAEDEGEGADQNADAPDDGAMTDAPEDGATAGPAEDGATDGAPDEGPAADMPQDGTTGDDTPVK